MDKTNKEALLNEIWEIVLDASPNAEIVPEIMDRLELLDPMLDNALGLNESGTRRLISFGLQKPQ